MHIKIASVIVLAITWIY